MYCDKIIFNGIVILTIYFKNAEGRARNLKKEFDFGTLIFIEESVKEIDYKLAEGYRLLYNGFLLKQDPINPCGETSCVYLEHYTNYNKPPNIIRFEEDKYFLVNTLDIEHLVAIIDFIKYYTGIDIEKNFSIIGDILVYNGSSIEVKLLKNEEIFLEKKIIKKEGIRIFNVPDNSRIIVKFKKHEHIVNVQTMEVKYLDQADNGEVKVLFDGDWGQTDIEIYRDSKVIYLDQDICWVEDIITDLHLMGPKHELSAKNIGKISVDNQIYSETIKITNRDVPIDKSSALKYFNLDLHREISNNKSSTNFQIILKDEVKQAIEGVSNFIMKAQEEVWIFDSYFTERNERAWIDTLVTLLNRCHASLKTIVFYSSKSEKAYNALELKEYMQDKKLIGDSLEKQDLNTFRLIETNEPIHDRFVLIKSKNMIECIVLGTSFNSIKKGMFCVHKYTGKEANHAYNILRNYVGNKAMINSIVIV